MGHLIRTSDVPVLVGDAFKNSYYIIHQVGFGFAESVGTTSFELDVMKHRHQTAILRFFHYIQTSKAALRGLATSLLLLLGVVAMGLPSQAEQRFSFRVIVHPDSEVKSLTVSEIRAKFYKKDLNWPDGTEVLPVDLPVDSRTRITFSDAILGKTPEEVQTSWFQRTFDGLTPPAEAANNAQVVSYVKSTPGAIGYVSRNTALGGTRSIDILADPAPIPAPEPEPAPSE